VAAGPMSPKRPRLWYARQEEAAKSATIASWSGGRRSVDCTSRGWSVQGLLVALGNVSKLLWPVRNRGATRRRGARLRESLSVADDSPLRDRSFRDHFEHFDERLDRRVRSSEDPDYADSNVGITPGKGVEYWFANEGYLRNIYRTDHPSKFAIAFRGENFYLAPVIDAVRELAGRAKIESQDLPGRRRM
jgi:hypothetical protein